MKEFKGVPVSGNKLKLLRKALSLSQEELGRAIGMTKGNLSDLENSVRGMQNENFRNLADKAGLSLVQLRAALAPDPGELDRNVAEQGDTFLLPPTFDWKIAAGPWVELDDDASNFHLDRRIVDQGRFRVRIRGDSMEPRWKDGSIVEFRRIIFGGEAIPFGEDCYFRCADGRATFKRLEQGDEHSWVLRPLNAKKYPKPMRVAIQEVVYLAVAEGEFRIPKK